MMQFGRSWKTGSLPAGPEINYHMSHMSNKKPGSLWFLGDYTTQLCGDYNKPL